MKRIKSIFLSFAKGFLIGFLIGFVPSIFFGQNITLPLGMNPITAYLIIGSVPGVFLGVANIFIHLSKSTESK